MAALKNERRRAPKAQGAESASAPMPGTGLSNSGMAARAAAARARRNEQRDSTSAIKESEGTEGRGAPMSSAHRRMIASVKDQTQFVFDLLRLGADRAMEDVTEPAIKDRERASSLLSVAANLALIGVAGGAGSAVATALRGALGSRAAKGVADMTKSVIKNGTSFGAGTTTKPSCPTLASEFRDAHDLKLHAAKSEAEVEFSDQLEPRLSALELSTLRRMRDSLVELNSSRELMQLQKRQTLVEWLNFKARASHGEGRASANVSASALQKAGHLGLNQAWRSLEADAVLELNVDLKLRSDDEGRRIWDLDVHSMHLHGVHQNAKAAVAAMGTVGEVPLNRIIRAIPSPHANPIAHQMEMPVQTMVVGADGQILSRNSDHRHTTLSSEKLWWMAQHMSLGHLGK